MDHAQHTAITTFIWAIADDVLREPINADILAMKRYLDDTGVAKTRMVSETAFTHYFSKPKPLRTLAGIRDDIEALERETEGLLVEILVG